MKKFRFVTKLLIYIIGIGILVVTVIPIGKYAQYVGNYWWLLSILPVTLLDGYFMYMFAETDIYFDMTDYNMKE